MFTIDFTLFGRHSDSPGNAGAYDFEVVGDLMSDLGAVELLALNEYGLGIPPAGYLSLCGR